MSLSAKMRAIVCILILFTFYPADAQPKNVRILTFRQSVCEPFGDPFKVQPRIIEQKEYGNIFYIRIGASTACCVKLEPSATLNNEALYLAVEETGDRCECSCYFELSFELQRVDDSFTRIFFQDEPIDASDEKYKIYDVTFKLVAGDTINLQDKYGRKQGKWSLSGEVAASEAYLEFKNDTLLRRVDLFGPGRIKSEILSGKLTIDDEGKRYWLYTFANRYVEYFESGKIKMECRGKNVTDAYWDGSCKEWNEQGELIHEGPYKK